jgi:hypothetical protein
VASIEERSFYVGKVLVVPDPPDYGRPVGKKDDRRPIVFPDKASKLAWLAEGARTGVVPPLPEGAYYE